VIQKYAIPNQSLLFPHPIVTNTLEAIELRAGDLGIPVHRRHRGHNSSFGFDLAILAEAQEAALSLKRGTVGNNVQCNFESRQGSALSANAHHGLDATDLRSACLCGRSGRFDPLLINTVVGLRPRNKSVRRQGNHRAGLEDHFLRQAAWTAGMGCDVPVHQPTPEADHE